MPVRAPQASLVGMGIAFNPALQYIGTGPNRNLPPFSANLTLTPQLHNDLRYFKSTTPPLVNEAYKAWNGQGVTGSPKCVTKGPGQPCGVLKGNTISIELLPAGKVQPIYARICTPAFVRRASQPRVHACGSASLLRC